MDRIDRKKLREERYAWEKANAPDALKGLSPDELHSHMKDAYRRHLNNEMVAMFSGLRRSESVSV